MQILSHMQSLILIREFLPVTFWYHIKHVIEIFSPGKALIIVFSGLL